MISLDGNAIGRVNGIGNAIGLRLLPAAGIEGSGRILTLAVDGDSCRWKLRFRDSTKRARTKWIGDVSKRAANDILRHTNELIPALEVGTSPDASAEHWALSLTGRLRERLAEFRLAPPEAPKLTTDAGRKLAAYLDANIGSRCDIKKTTETNYNQTRRLLVEYFKSDRSSRSITAADAERWRRWM